MRHQRDQTITENVTYAIECDNCLKRAEVKPARYAQQPKGWAMFSSSHNDWANDSVDSREEHDVCSWACYVAVVRRVLEEYRVGRPPSPTLMVDGHDWEFLNDMLNNVAPEAAGE